MNINRPVSKLLAGSWKWWVGRETITYVSIMPDGIESEYIIDDTKRFEISQRDAPPQKTGGYIAGDMTWIIPSQKLPAMIYPKMGDRIKDCCDAEFTILDSFQNGWQNWWRLSVRNLVFVLGLRNTLSFWRPQYVNSGGTRSVSAYTPIRLNVPGKIIETGDEYTPDTFGVRQTRERFDIYSLYWIRWEPGDQIRDQAGKIYTIISSGPPNQLDAANLYTCEVVR
jgi:hypothetical protein